MRTSLILLMFFLGYLNVNACDRSGFNWVSTTPSGGNFIINVSLDIGGGILGVVRGGDDFTSTFGFGFYTPGGIPMNIIAFTPATVTSDTTGTTNFGGNSGPAGPPFNMQGSITYSDLGSPNPLVCINSTVVCGRPHTQTFNFSFTVDVMPDSIRAFGIEGAGNPLAGCYPNSDMLIDFAVILPVDWLSIQASSHPHGAAIEWVVENEELETTYEVHRSVDGIEFETMAFMVSADNLETRNAYSWVDENPYNQNNYYRVRSIEPDGYTSFSETVSYVHENNSQIIIQHHSVDRIISIRQNVVGPLNVVIYNTQGQIILRETITNQHTQQIALSNLPKGLLYVTVQNDTAQRSRALMNM